MKLPQIYLLAIVMVFFSCQNLDSTHSQVDTSKLQQDSTRSMASSLTGCYEYNVGRDTIRLSLQLQDSTVSGSLLYDMYEKDKSRGTIKGRVKDSIIVTNYSFNSEGMDSEAEVFFQFKNDSLYLGEGPQTVKDGKGVYLDHSKIQYKTAFRKINCH